MIGMAVSSAQLFFRGKLFHDNPKVFGIIALGVAVTVVLFLGARMLGLAPWIAAAPAGLIGGALQPFLLRNVKYR